MIMHCSPAEGWTLREPEAFGSFKIVLDASEAVPTIEGLSLDGGGHAWVMPDLLVRLAGDAATPVWRTDLRRMIGMAAKHGWVREDGAVRAHIEREK